MSIFKFLFVMTILSIPVARANESLIKYKTNLFLAKDNGFSSEELNSTNKPYLSTKHGSIFGVEIEKGFLSSLSFHFGLEYGSSAVTSYVPDTNSGLNYNSMLSTAGMYGGARVNFFQGSLFDVFFGAGLSSAYQGLNSTAAASDGRIIDEVSHSFYSFGHYLESGLSINGSSYGIRFRGKSSKLSTSNIKAFDNGKLHYRKNTLSIDLLVFWP